LTLGEALARAAGYLDRKGVSTPRLDAELLLAHAFGLSRIELYTEYARPLSEAELEPARALVRRRGSREPLAYVLGEWGFRTLVLRTDARALVPRPETELLVERALALVDGITAPRIADVGTGSGAIALAIASERPDAQVVATDASRDALDLARENAESLGLEIALVHTSLVAGLTGPFDLVVSNPPYVDAEELETLIEEVRVWEPREALVDEGQTLALAAGARTVLAVGGALALECHEARAGSVAAALASLGYEGATITRDLAGKDRVVEARWEPMSSGR
jgi:release factor glutamine methyltransferase